MTTRRAKIFVRGAVQGVGFRPFVYRLANELQLRGSVCNSSQGVAIEAEGDAEQVQTFIARLESEKPPHANILSLNCSFIDPIGQQAFEICESSESGDKSAQVLPDIATCPDCLHEIFDCSNRRYLYPFTNCTNCGPRFTIMEGLPYDRAKTSMKRFTMCAECEAEYHNPRDRRFHAQPNACPNCGPQVELFDHRDLLEQRHRAIALAAHMIRMGKILAVKGIGGFHLMVDAANDAAVEHLRERKRREQKPFAVMFPSVEAIRATCEVSDVEAQLLSSPEAPIVLLRANGGQQTVSKLVAPNNPNLGVILPYSPLHHILMRELGIAVVATSGNISDEPICTDADEARERLRDIADLFLVHDRPIVRHADDSIVRVIAGCEMLVRGGRGYAPIHIAVPYKTNTTVAVGAHLKNTVALHRGDTVIISQHLGDLEGKESRCAFTKAIADLEQLYDAPPDGAACDLHPDYASTTHARELGIPVAAIQHHHAHALACLAENTEEPPALAIVWDGTGLGTNGTIWGGEFLRVDSDGFERVAHFRTFGLPGGDAASRQPWRSAIGLLREICGKEIHCFDALPPFAHCSKPELALTLQILEGRRPAPLTSSMGRLFDAVASLVGLRQKSVFEGQAAMELEFAADTEVVGSYRYSIQEGKPLVIDWEPTIISLIEDIRQHTAVATIAAKFHHTLVEIIAAIAKRIAEPKVVLSGGSFQNALLLSTAIARLRADGFHVIWHQRVPTNDGGIALGQAIGAMRTTKLTTSSQLQT